VPDETVSPGQPNLLLNPDFETYSSTLVCNDAGFCVTHIVPDDWEPHYCDKPYMPEPCNALYQGTKNPADLMMRRPEYKIAKLAEYPNRVFEGYSSAQWFCYSGVCRAGLYQVVETEPGMLCEVGAHVQSWNNYKGDQTSESQSQDDRDNITWRIVINLAGKTLSFLDDNLASRWYGYEDFPYDTWGKIEYQFVTNSHETTVFFESLVLFPVTNNDVYLDAAYLRCQ
jgi:hypothetical protein